MTTPFLAQVNIFLNHPTKTKLCPRENGHRASILLTEEAGLRALQFRFEPRVLPRCRALAVSGTAEDLRGGGRCRFSGCCRFSREHSTVGAGGKIPWQGGDCCLFSGSIGNLKDGGRCRFCSDRHRFLEAFNGGRCRKLFQTVSDRARCSFRIFSHYKRASG